jgi:S1-C subfamily serine protease
VTNINELDLNRFSFDYDLTMAFVIAHPDGTVYHRYGGRTSVSPMHMDDLIHIMQEGLVSHAAYMKNPKPPEQQEPLLVRDLVSERLQGKMKPAPGCIHCHYVKEARNYLQLESGTWTPNQFWTWPLPERIGITMNQSKQHVIETVTPDSPAGKAGMEVGDVLHRLEGKRIMSNYDIQAVLESSKDEAIFLSFEVQRKNASIEGLIHLEPAWKTGDPKDNAWRFRNVFTQHMLKFLPAPGFIGDLLSNGEFEAMSLADRNFGLRISNLNVGTYLAGIRQGDIILGAGGKSNFTTVREFHHWCELLRRAGRDLRLEVYRENRPMFVMVNQAHLNYSRVEEAPRVDLGFIAQELPRDDGLRVGHVNDSSPAEQAGLRIGDRIVTVDDLRVSTYREMQNLLNKKSPGQLLMLQVRRENLERQVSYVLPGEEDRKSSVALLSAVPIEPGQLLHCVVTIDVPAGKHIYSMQRPSLGLPTTIDFRGRGYALVGPVKEPAPHKIEAAGLDPNWVLDGKIELEQTIRITDLARFKMVLRVYAQVCDENGCHEFQAVVTHQPGEQTFADFRDRFEDEVEIERK